MSEISTNVAREGKDSSDSSSSEEGSSILRSEQTRQHSSFWSRALRLIRPSQGEQLREDFAGALMADTDIGNAFSPDERAMLNNILRFREVRVEDIMVPRADIEGVDMSDTIGEVLIHFEETGRSRMPVYNDTLDDPRGMIHIRDLLSYLAKQARNKRRTGGRVVATPVDAVSAKTQKPPRQPRAAFDLARVDLEKSVADAGLVRKILFVPPSMRAAELLKSMQAERTQLALVIDEYGGTDGLVSHEDIIEMVVGDVEDEHDSDEVMFSKVNDNLFIVDARIELEEIAEAIGPDFDLSARNEDVDTLGGLIFASLDRIPARDEVVQVISGFDFQIIEADARRIKRVRVIRRHGDAQHSSEAPGISDQRPSLLLAPPVRGQETESPASRAAHS